MCDGRADLAGRDRQRRLDQRGGSEHIAVTNAEIEEIWRAVPDGTTLEIVP